MWVIQVCWLLSYGITLDFFFFSMLWRFWPFSDSYQKYLSKIKDFDLEFIIKGFGSGNIREYTHMLATLQGYLWIKWIQIKSNQIRKSWVYLKWYTVYFINNSLFIIAHKSEWLKSMNKSRLSEWTSIVSLPLKLFCLSYSKLWVYPHYVQYHGLNKFIISII